jgi:mRNA interferase RelE/StbE
VRYIIEFRPSARRDLKPLPADVIRRVDKAILALEENPRPPTCTKMSGRENRYRIRVGDYRILYEVRDDVLLVLVVRIGHRREVYRSDLTR